MEVKDDTNSLRPASERRCGPPVRKRILIGLAVLLVIGIIVIVIAVPVSVTRNNSSTVDVSPVQASYEYTLTLYGATTGSQFSAASTSTNFNGDGYDDIMCGAPNEAAVYLMFGRPIAFDATKNAVITANTPDSRIKFVGLAGDGTGQGVATGDINHDGIL